MNHTPKQADGKFQDRKARWLMDRLGHEWCGNEGTPPLQGHGIYVLEDEGLTRVFSMVDDGGYVGIGYPDDWHSIIRWRTARMFAWWVLRTWASDWFGLRSAIYYRALNRWCSGSWKRLGRRDREVVRRSSHAEWFASKNSEPA